MSWRPDPGRLTYGLRTGAGAMLALGLAWALGFEHPQWAGMTVWAASQPVREHLLEKSAFRAIGTVAGAVFGALLAGLAARTGGPPVLVIGVALWVGLCAAAGNLLRSFASYGALLAGFTAVMVALLDGGNPDDVVALGLDRMATVLIGVAVALVIGLTLTPRAAEADVPRRLRLAGAGILREIAATLRGTAPRDLVNRLAELAAIDDEIDGAAAGSAARRREGRNRRETLMAQVAALVWLRAPTAGPDPGAATAVEAIAAAYDANVPAPERRLALAQAARRSEPGLRRVLAELGAALPRRDEGPLPERAPEPLVLHRDWIVAREAGVRSAVTILAIGAVWIATGWAGGPLVMLGAAIMTSVFSTFDNPFAILPKVALGQAMGATAAIACRWLVWPHLGSEAELLLAMFPFILLGAILTGYPRLQVQSFDYNMVLLLLLQPVWPLTGSFGHSLVLGVAVVGAPFVALLAFRLIHPPSAGRRRDALLRTMTREVEAMAAHPDSPRRAAVWRARMHHQLLRLVRWSERAGTRADEAVSGGFALLLAARAIVALRARIEDPALSSSARRRLSLARARCAALGRAPDRAARALGAAARLGGRDAIVLSTAAEAIRLNAPCLGSARQTTPPSDA